MDLHQSFLVVGEGNGRIHKRREAEEIPEPAAQCGTKCKNGLTPLHLDEDWGRYLLCGKCFGPERGCTLLCDYMEKKKKRGLVRCGRRCSPLHVKEHTTEVPGGRDGVRGLHRCAIHSLDVQE